MAVNIWTLTNHQPSPCPIRRFHGGSERPRQALRREMWCGVVEGEGIEDRKCCGLVRLRAGNWRFGKGSGRGCVGGEIGAEMLQGWGEDEGYAGREGEVLEGRVEETVWLSG